jgi:hypothetical protein
LASRREALRVAGEFKERFLEARSTRDEFAHHDTGTECRLTYPISGLTNYS